MKPLARSLSAALLALSLLPGAALRADKLDKEAKKWLDDVAPLLLPTEEKTYKDLKDKADVAEFQKIFWARRDAKNQIPSPENEFRTAYELTRAEADRRFHVGVRPGWMTDCGRVFILFGEPDETKKQPYTSGRRPPETWTYKSRAGLSIKSGQMQVDFDGECMFPPEGDLRDDLRRMAESKVANPNLDYKLGKDGRLVKLDLLQKFSPAQALLKTPREDFPVETQTTFLKVQDGGTAVVGLVRGDASGLASQVVAGKKVVKVTICAQALSQDGRPAASYESTTLAEVIGTSFVASYRIGLKPGTYTLRAGALEEASKKGSLTTGTIEVPDYGKGELSATTPLIVREIEDNASADPEHPYAAFLLGTTRFIPHYGTVFSSSDSLLIFYQFYEAQVDEKTGKGAVVANFSILKGSKAVAKAADQPFEVSIGGTVVGPVPLAKYEPGQYVIQLKITDSLAKKEITRELPFEVK